jgi:hypothetical protein
MRTSHAGNPGYPPRIEGLEMRKAYYNRMRIPALFVPVATVSLLGAASGVQRQTTLKTSSLESHEGVTISADPWTDAAKYKAKFPKKSPYAAGIVAIEVTIRNDSDDSMRVGLDRIRLNVTLSEDSRQGLLPLTPDDVADVVMGAGKKDPTLKRNRFPVPIGGPKVGKDKHWTEVQQAAAAAGISGPMVAPHRSIQGLLYFDLQGQVELLSAAHLYVPDVTALEKNHSLLYFEIDLGQPTPH